MKMTIPSVVVTTNNLASNESSTVYFWIGFNSSLMYVKWKRYVNAKEYPFSREENNDKSSIQPSLSHWQIYWLPAKAVCPSFYILFSSSLAWGALLQYNNWHKKIKNNTSKQEWENTDRRKICNVAHRCSVSASQLLVLHTKSLASWLEAKRRSLQAGKDPSELLSNNRVRSLPFPGMWDDVAGKLSRAKGLTGESRFSGQRCLVLRIEAKGTPVYLLLGKGRRMLRIYTQTITQREAGV